MNTNPTPKLYDRVKKTSALDAYMSVPVGVLGTIIRVYQDAVWILFEEHQDGVSGRIKEGAEYKYGIDVFNSMFKILTEDLWKNDLVVEV